MQDKIKMSDSQRSLGDDLFILGASPDRDVHSSTLTGDMIVVGGSPVHSSLPLHNLPIDINYNIDNFNNNDDNINNNRDDLMVSGGSPGPPETDTGTRMEDARNGRKKKIKVNIRLPRTTKDIFKMFSVSQTNLIRAGHSPETKAGDRHTKHYFN